MNDGGPAFPVQDCSKWQCHGLSLRDYFAAAALQGALKDRANVVKLAEHAETDGMTIPAFIAQEMYVIADAMLAAREAKESAK